MAGNPAPSFQVPRLSPKAAPQPGLLSHFYSNDVSAPRAARNSSPSLQPPAASAPTVAWPLTYPVFPEGGVEALIYHHKMKSMVSGEMYCWTYISKGLARVGQKEIVFTIRRRASEGQSDISITPFQWMKMVYSAARDGQRVDEFQRTEFHSPSFLDRSDFKWVVYCRAQSIDNVLASYFPNEWLQAIPLIDSEAEVAKRYGLMRTLGHLGTQERWFPYPPWIDRDRHPCITMANMAGTMKDSLPLVIVRGISAVKKGAEIALYVPEESASSLKEALSQFEIQHVFALDSTLHKDADSSLLWSNTDTQPRAYGAGMSNACMNLGYFAFCPCQKDNELKMIEDGYIFMISNSTWATFRKAIEQSTSSGITLSSGLRFTLQFEKSRPGQSIDPSSTLPTEAEPPPVASSPAASGFTKYTPKNPTPEHQKPTHVHCNHIALLDNNITNAADVGKLTNFIKLIENVVDIAVPKTAPPGVVGGGKLVIEADVGGPDRDDLLGREWFKMSFSPPSLSALPMDQIYTEVSRVPKPDIEPRRRFALAFNVWGFQGPWS
ncbi:hypothetical protein AJ79_04757 [Helicocarpus griseus UAMH5409]|uniref:Uncharacterized protein n=1 Tax=Helicocarpus griseus UAMH5409 TaxID=1447875 RepID=A0A2B7XT05_9EURO|nr:hypothetical protein AJ79_04757 [Helicocarpus griseus UAMH5409]